MTALHRIYRFVDGRMVRAEPPAWFSSATAESDDWLGSLGRAGATAVEDFDNGGESLHIFEGPEGDYFIGYWDATKCVIEVFIDNIADYLQFRANYIAPLAQLVMEVERHEEWRKGKKFRAA